MNEADASAGRRGWELPFASRPALATVTADISAVNTLGRGFFIFFPSPRLPRRDPSPGENRLQDFEVLSQRPTSTAGRGRFARRGRSGRLGIDAGPGRCRGGTGSNGPRRSRGSIRKPGSSRTWSRTRCSRWCSTRVRVQPRVVPSPWRISRVRPTRDGVGADGASVSNQPRPRRSDQRVDGQDLARIRRLADSDGPEPRRTSRRPASDSSRRARTTRPSVGQVAAVGEGARSDSCRVGG